MSVSHNDDECELLAELNIALFNASVRVCFGPFKSFFKQMWQMSTNSSTSYNMLPGCGPNMLKHLEFVPLCSQTQFPLLVSLNQ